MCYTPVGGIPRRFCLRFGAGAQHLFRTWFVFPTTDPSIGVESTACAAVMHGRKAAGSETEDEYVYVARERIQLALLGELRVRPMDRPIYQPDPNSKLARKPADLGELLIDE